MNFSFSKNEIFSLKNNKNYPFHPDNQQIKLSEELKTKQNVHSSMCIVDSALHSIPFYLVTSSNHNIIFKKYPNYDDEEIYNSKVQITSQKFIFQDLQEKISSQFQQVRTLIENILKQEEEELNKQIVSLLYLNEKIISQNNENTVKDKLQDSFERKGINDQNISQNFQNNCIKEVMYDSNTFQIEQDNKNFNFLIYQQNSLNNSFIEECHDYYRRNDQKLQSNSLDKYTIEVENDQNPFFRDNKIIKTNEQQKQQIFQNNHLREGFNDSNIQQNTLNQNQIQNFQIQLSQKNGMMKYKQQNYKKIGDFIQIS